MFKLGIVLLLTTGVLSQNAGIGSCPNVKVVQNFDASKYMGEWYEIAKYFFVFELGGKCVTANYTSNSDGSFKFANSQINIITGHPSTSEATATFSGNKTEGKLNIVYPSGPIKIPAPYWILGTDYDNYAVVYTCTDLLLFHTKVVWILARTREPSSTVLNQALEVLKDNKLSKSQLIKTNQKNCS